MDRSVRFLLGIITILGFAAVSSGGEVFVEKGAAKQVRQVGRKWSQGTGYLECRGEVNYLFADKMLGEGDFHLRAKIALQELNGSAASFMLGNDHLGFDGRTNKVFAEGTTFGGPEFICDSADVIKAGRPFLFEAIRKKTELIFLIDGKEIWKTSKMSSGNLRFALRPWRSTMRVYEFSAEGNLVDWPVESQMPPGYTIPLIDLADQKHRQVLVDREKGQYLGHPTTVLLEDNKTMIAVYPKGHGKGGIVMKRSTDAGLTWSDRLPVPESWATSREVPTIHRVIDKNGVKRLIMFSGLYPIRMAVSEDDGKNWSELEPIGDYGGIVTMGCVVPLKNGDYMAMFHDDGRFLQNKGKQEKFNVYKVISTNGGLTWGQPEIVATHPEAHLCEPGVIRSPNGRQLAMLMRENSRKFNSFVAFSHDEGKSWTKPWELPASLTGDRHIGRYAPDGRLFITFRDTTRESPTQGDWVGWVGTYEDIMRRHEGQYRVRLMDNKHNWDCAYPGLELLPDGTFVTTTYGHWDQGEQPYIMSVRFRMEELDAMAAKLPKKTVVYKSGDNGYHTYRIPSLLVTKAGTVLAFCEGRKGGRSDAGNIDMLVKRSADGGKTWSDQQVIWDEADNTCGNPCPVMDEATGTIWLLMTWNRGDDPERNIIDLKSKDTRRVYVTSSTDDGKTWAKPTEITEATKLSNWTWYATGPCTGIQLQKGPHKGRLVIPCDHIEADTKKYYSHVIYSDDHGLTWKLGGSTPQDQVNECQVTELSDGRLMLNMRNYYRAEKFRAISTSDNGGITWSAIHRDISLPEPRCQASFIRYSLAEDEGKNRLLFSNPAHTDQRVNMTIKLSYDEGKTWPIAKTLHAGPAAYSCLARLPYGHIACLYEAGENSPYETITFERFPLEYITEESFTVVVLPDTQNYCDSNVGPAENFYAQTRWIKDNKDKLNIVMVAHLGDIVNNPQMRDEWIVADKAFKIIDNEVPYILNVGNHDIGDNGNSGNTRETLLNEYFPVKRFTENAIYDRHFGDDKAVHFFPAGSSENYYLLFEDFGVKFIIISLEFKPRDEALEWANKVVKEHSDRRCIFITHGYLDSNGVFSQIDRYAVQGNNCDKMWDKFLKKHPNIFMLLCGHAFGETKVVDKGDAGNVIYQLLADYQHLENGGNGFLRIMKFFPLADKIEVSTYSPVLNKELTSETSRFTLEYNMSAIKAK